MRSVGRISVAVAVTAIAPWGHADYLLLSLTGPATVAPGETFELTAVLTSDANDVIDSMIFDVLFNGPRPLIYSGYVLAGNVEYQTGSLDDFSVPKGALDTGRFATPPLITDGLAPQAGANVHIEAITRPGVTFSSGVLATLNLTMPANAELGEAFDVAPVPDTFGCGDFDCTPWQSGGPIRINVIPEPGTFALVALGGSLALSWIAMRRNELRGPKGCMR